MNVDRRGEEEGWLAGLVYVPRVYLGRLIAGRATAFPLLLFCLVQQERGWQAGLWGRACGITALLFTSLPYESREEDSQDLSYISAFYASLFLTVTLKCNSRVV